LTAQEKGDLTAFLGRPLTDPRVRDELPPFDRPTLSTETDRVPQLFGSATAASNGVAPRMIAVEPPLLGSPSLTVGIDADLGGARAVLIVDRADAPGGKLVRGATNWLGVAASEAARLTLF